MFPAKHKYIWIFGDGSQAEARVVAWKGPVPALKEWFLTGQDVHLNVAKMIGRVVQEQKLKMPGGLFNGKPWTDYTKDDEERQKGKVTVHSNNYDVGVGKFAVVSGLPELYAKMLQGIYHGVLPEIRGNYQKNIRTAIDKTRMLVTSWGRRIVCYDKIGQDNLDVYREMYAWYAQNEVGDFETEWLCRCCEVFTSARAPVTWTPEAIRAQGLDVRLQVHDALGIVVPNDRETIEWTVRKADELSKIPMIINGEELIIPVDFKIGVSWGDLKSFKL